MFRKKLSSTAVAEDRAIISRNAEKIGELTLIVKNSDIVTKLNELRELLKYLIPLEFKSAIEQDLKIGAKIDDLKIELARGDGYSENKINRIITEIQICIIGRKDHI